MRGGWNKGKKRDRPVPKITRARMAFVYWKNRIGEEQAKIKVEREWGVVLY